MLLSNMNSRLPDSYNFRHKPQFKPISCPVILTTLLITLQIVVLISADPKSKLRNESIKNRYATIRNNLSKIQNLIIPTDENQFDDHEGDLRSDRLKRSLSLEKPFKANKSDLKENQDDNSERSDNSQLVEQSGNDAAASEIIQHEMEPSESSDSEQETQTFGHKGLMDTDITQVQPIKKLGPEKGSIYKFNDIERRKRPLSFTRRFARRTASKQNNEEGDGSADNNNNYELPLPPPSRAERPTHDDSTRFRPDESRNVDQPSKPVLGRGVPKPIDPNNEMPQIIPESFESLMGASEVLDDAGLQDDVSPSAQRNRQVISRRYPRYELTGNEVQDSGPSDEDVNLNDNDRSFDDGDAGSGSDLDDEDKRLPAGSMQQVSAQRNLNDDLKTAAGHHYGHDHGHYYMYAKVPKKKSWEFGFKRGNKKHWIERHEKGHKNKFKTKVKWYDKKSKGKGIHIWDYNHYDKKKHHGF